ncbi:peptidase M23 [Caldibacillus thermoamylovorans]
METTLKTVLFVLLFAFIIQMQFNLDADKTATRQLKNGIELAVHDAAMAVVPESIAEGKIVFNEDQAISNLRDSLETNLNVDSEGGYVYTPNETSFFKNKLYVVDLVFLDDRVERTYPFTYENSTYNITQQIKGPSVLAIISTESPRWFRGGKTLIRQAAIYEYSK